MAAKNGILLQLFFRGFLFLYLKIMSSDIRYDILVRNFEMSINGSENINVLLISLQVYRHCQ